MVKVAQSPALKEMSLGLSRSWVLIRSVKTTSDCNVDFLERKKSLSKKNHHVAQLGEDTLAVTTGKQINPKPESSRGCWYLAAIFSDHVLRVPLGQMLEHILNAY